MAGSATLFSTSLAAAPVGLERADWEAQAELRLVGALDQRTDLMHRIEERLDRLPLLGAVPGCGVRAGAPGADLLAGAFADALALLSQRHLSSNIDSRMRGRGSVSAETGSMAAVGVADVPDRIRSYIAIMFHAGPRGQDVPRGCEGMDAMRQDVARFGRTGCPGRTGSRPRGA